MAQAILNPSPVDQAVGLSLDRLNIGSPLSEARRDAAPDLSSLDAINDSLRDQIKHLEKKKATVKQIKTLHKDSVSDHNQFQQKFSQRIRQYEQHQGEKKVEHLSKTLDLMKRFDEQRQKQHSKMVRLQKELQDLQQKEASMDECARREQNQFQYLGQELTQYLQIHQDKSSQLQLQRNEMQLIHQQLSEVIELQRAQNVASGQPSSPRPRNASGLQKFIGWMRSSQRSSSQQPQQQPPTPEPTTEPEAITTVNVVSSDSVVNANTVTNVYIKTSDQVDTCAICMGGYEENHVIRRLPCTHFYHIECVDEWFTKKKTCPTCLLSIQN